MNPHLLTHETADDYVRGMARVTQLVAQHLAADAPSTGATVADLTPAVEGVDLDRPAADLDAALAHATRVAAVTVSRPGADPPWPHELG